MDSKLLLDVFTRDFIDDDDHERMVKLGLAVVEGAFTVEYFEGEDEGQTSPPELHVYVRGTAPDASPIFACILGSPAVIAELAAQPPGYVMESCWFQAMASVVTQATVAAAVTEWASRLWPELPPPRIVSVCQPGRGNE